MFFYEYDETNIGDDIIGVIETDWLCIKGILEQSLADENDGMHDENSLILCNVRVYMLHHLQEKR